MKKLKKTKGKGIFGIITKVTALAAVISCVVSIIVTNSSHAEMKKELDALNSKTEELKAENAELERILADNDMDAYMEKIAIEKMNYAYPDERRFYDTSRN